MAKGSGPRTPGGASILTRSDPDPKPLAAFRLGYPGVTIWDWLWLVLEMPGYDGVDDSVPLAIDQLNEARENLADEMSSNVFQAVPPILEELLPPA